MNTDYVGGTEQSYHAAHATAAILFLFALLARLIFLGWHGPGASPDTPSYMILADNLLKHSVFSSDTEPIFTPTIRRAPLYSVFLASIIYSGISSPFLIALTQSVLDSFVAVLIFLLARLVVPQKWATSAALTYSIHPGAIFFACTLLSESLFTVLLMCAVVMIVLGIRRDRLPITGLGGAAIGLAILCRALALPIPLVFLGILLLSPKQPRRHLHGGLLLASAAMVVLPWSVRCSLLARQFVPVSSSVGAMVYTPTRWDWNQLDYARTWSSFYKSSYGRLYVGAKTAEQAAEADRVGIHLAIRNIKSEPIKYLVSRARTFPYLFINSLDFFTGIDRSFGTLFAQRDMPRLMIKLFLLIFFTLVPFVLGVIGVLRGRHHFVTALCSSIWVYTLAAYFPMWIEFRYWVPCLPFLLVSAAYGAHSLQSRSI